MVGSRSGLLVPAGARIVEDRERSQTPLAPVGQRAVVPAEPDMLRATKRTRKKKASRAAEEVALAPKPVHRCYAMGCGITDEEDASALKRITCEETRNGRPTGRTLREWWACSLHYDRFRPGYAGQGTVQDWRTVGAEKWMRLDSPSMSQAGTHRAALLATGPVNQGRISGHRKRAGKNKGRR